MFDGIANLAGFFARHPLTKSAPHRAWGRLIGWQVRSRLQAEVIVPWIGGQKLAVRRGMTGATGNIYAGLHEFSDMMFPLHFLRPDDLFFDIGANVGTYTIIGSGVCRARTWAFEPDPGTADFLLRNVAINNLTGLVTVHKLAVGDADTIVAFTVGMDSMNRVTGAIDSGSQHVTQCRLDSIAETELPIMLKIDVEGYEHAVLTGAQRLLTDRTLKALEIETITPEIEATLTAVGFSRVWYDPFTRRLHDQPCLVDASNALYVRDRDFVTNRLSSAPAVEILGRKI